MRYFLNRLREPSTLAGLAALATLAGVPAESVGLGAQAVGGVLGLLAVLVPEGAK